MPEPELLSGNTLNRLGEGVLWHPTLKRLFWFDILEGHLYWCNADGSGLGSQALGRMASAATWVDQHMLLLAMEDGIYTYVIEAGAIQRVVSLEDDNPSKRSNDGRCDPWGRFWISTMDKQAAKGRGGIYLLDGTLTMKCIKDGLTIPNSIAFSPDRKCAYFADGADQTIFAFDLDPNSGEILGERVFASTKGEDAVPDGSVVDADGCLWNAQWDGWRVVRYLPDGTIDRIVFVPVQRPTCPAFGGEDLRTLYLSSAREGLDLRELKGQPRAGGLWAIDIGIQGLPEPAFRAESSISR